LRDPKLIEEFRLVLESAQESGTKKEQEIQNYLEGRSELIPTPHRLNHHLHLKAIISKFPLGSRFITDYVYITKSSDCWRIVFVELEVPDKTIFTNSSNQINTTAKFNEALNQIRNWQAYLNKHRQEVIKQLEPLMVPPNMRRNPVELCFELVYGRSAEKNTEERNRHIKLLSEQSNIKIMTYDTLLSYYENDLIFKKDIMSYKQGKFYYKNLVTKPEHVFSYIGPGDLKLTNDQKSTLCADGYEIDKWNNGEMLTRNIRYTKSTFDKKGGIKSMFTQANT
jgi:hypothetical protein